MPLVPCFHLPNAAAGSDRPLPAPEISGSIASSATFCKSSTSSIQSSNLSLSVTSHKRLPEQDRRLKQPKFEMLRLVAVDVGPVTLVLNRMSNWAPRPLLMIDGFEGS